MNVMEFILLYIVVPVIAGMVPVVVWHLIQLRRIRKKYRQEIQKLLEQTRESERSRYSYPDRTGTGEGFPGTGGMGQ